MAYGPVAVSRINCWVPPRRSRSDGSRSSRRPTPANGEGRSARLFSAGSVWGRSRCRSEDRSVGPLEASPPSVRRRGCSSPVDLAAAGMSISRPSSSARAIENQVQSWLVARNRSTGGAKHRAWFDGPPYAPRLLRVRSRNTWWIGELDYSFPESCGSGEGLPHGQQLIVHRVLDLRIRSTEFRDARLVTKRCRAADSLASLRLRGDSARRQGCRKSGTCGRNEKDPSPAIREREYLILRLPARYDKR